MFTISVEFLASFDALVESFSKIASWREKSFRWFFGDKRKKGTWVGYIYKYTKRVPLNGGFILLSIPLMWICWLPGHLHRSLGLFKELFLSPLNSNDFSRCTKGNNVENLAVSAEQNPAGRWTGSASHWLQLCFQFCVGWKNKFTD